MSSARLVERSVPVLLALAALAAAPAAELVLKDVGFRVEALPDAFDYTVTGPASAISGSDTYLAHLSAALVGRWALVPAGGRQGPVLGGELFQELGRFDGGGTEMLGARASLGWGFALSREATVLALARGGIGRGRFRLDAVDIAASGRQSALGAEAVLRWRIAPAWHIEASLGWLRVRDAFADGSLAIDLREAGPTAGIGLAWSVSQAPGGL